MPKSRKSKSRKKKPNIKTWDCPACDATDWSHTPLNCLKCGTLMVERIIVEEEKLDQATGHWIKYIPGGKYPKYDEKVLFSFLSDEQREYETGILAITPLSNEYIELKKSVIMILEDKNVWYAKINEIND